MDSIHWIRSVFQSMHVRLLGGPFLAPITQNDPFCGQKCLLASACGLEQSGDPTRLEQH